MPEAWKCQWVSIDNFRHFIPEVTLWFFFQCDHLFEIYHQVCLVKKISFTEIAVNVKWIFIHSHAVYCSACSGIVWSVILYAGVIQQLQVSLREHCLNTPVSENFRPAPGTICCSLFSGEIHVFTNTFTTLYIYRFSLLSDCKCYYIYYVNKIGKLLMFACVCQHERCITECSF